MNPERLARITIDDAQCGGRPCIRGMRIRVTDVLDLLGAGASFEEVLDDYPYLEREDLLHPLSMQPVRQTIPCCSLREISRR
jgi:uncharacterized protein (DUF433 family)